MNRPEAAMAQQHDDDDANLRWALRQHAIASPAAPRTRGLRFRKSGDRFSDALAGGGVFGGTDAGHSSSVPGFYAMGYNPDPRKWTWTVWLYLFGYASLWCIVVAGFILLIVDRGKCVQSCI